MTFFSDECPSRQAVLVVTPNPAIDVTYAIPVLTPGGTNRVTGVQRRAGGKGLNVARAFRSLNIPVQALQPVGGGFGSIFAQALAADGIPALNIPISGETRLTVTVDESDRHPTVLSEPGPLLTDDEWRIFIEQVEHEASKCKWVVLAGAFPPGSGDEHVTALVRSAHRGGARVAVDTSGRQLQVSARAGADLVKSNEIEAVEATGCGEILNATAALAQSGGHVIITRGADGLVLRAPDGSLVHQRAFPRVRGNPTGAGDAATAGYLAANLSGLNDRESLIWAAACGAAAVGASRAGEIDLNILEELTGRSRP